MTTADSGTASAGASPRVLIAGIGNVFLHDDGFGVEVVDRLHDAVLPDWVQVADYGISGVHLACELVGDYDTTILIDATPRGGEPGTVYLIEPEQPTSESSALDAHGMRPEVLLRLLRLLDGDAGRVLVVGCEPDSTEHGMGLSPAVAGAIDEAVRLVTDLAWGDSPRDLASPAAGFHVLTHSRVPSHRAVTAAGRDAPR